MAARKPLFMGTEGFSEEMATSDSMTLGGLTMGGNIDMNSAGKIVNANAATADGDVLVYGQNGANLDGLDIDTNPLTMNSQKITGLGAPTGTGDAATKDYVDQQVISGGNVKEALFSEDQLDDTDGINALEAMYFAGQPAVGDTIVLKNGTLTETYTFVANQGAESAATDVSIETDADTAMARFVLRANADAGNTQWDLEYETGTHADINDPIIDVVEKASAAGDSDSRIYTAGAWTTAGDCKVVEFAAGGVVDLDYTNRTAVSAPTSDPAEGRFGLRRQVVALTDGEIHLTLDTDNQWSWDNDGTTWNQMSGPGSIPLATSASGGGIVGRVTFDSDFGLSVTAGVAKIAALASGGVKFSSGEIAVEPNDFAGTGLEDDGSDNLRLASQGNGIAGGAGATLSVDSDTETGGNIQGANVTANGVGLDINAIAGTGIEADGSANLRLASQGNGIAGGAGSTLSVDPDSETGGDTQPVSVGANGVGLDISAIAGTGLEADGSANLRIAAAAAGDGLTGGAGSALAVNLEASNPTLQIVTDELGLKIKAAGGLAVDASGVYVTGTEEAPKLENGYTTATDAIAVADPIYINGNDTVGKATADTDAKARVIGVNRVGAGAAPQSIQAVNAGPAEDVLSGATAGTPYYLQATGGIGTSLPAGGNRVVMVGYALNADDLFVRITDYGKKAA